ncbi:MAG: thioesterase family protein, partial [Thermodesulfobacteriota bacterium]
FKSMDEELRKKAVYFMAIDKVRFRKPVHPGDQIKMEMVVSKQRKSVWAFTGRAYVEDQLVAEAELMAMVGDKGSRKN